MAVILSAAGAKGSLSLARSHVVHVVNIITTELRELPWLDSDPFTGLAVARPAQDDHGGRRSLALTWFGMTRQGSAHPMITARKGE